MVDVAGIIPARDGSTRLPGKPLADLGGKPLIRHVYERASQALSTVIVATDDERVLQAVRAFGGRAVLTRADHRCGTERVAEVAEGLTADIIVNIQGDEPFIDPPMIREVIAPLVADADLPMATLSRKITSEEDLANPGVVKVVTDHRGDALYFSRSLIPYPRHSEFCRWREHVGIYAYRRGFLLAYVQWAPTPLEQAESLEQLRVLEHGLPIRVVETACGQGTFSIDTPEDLARANAYLHAQDGSLSRQG
jgi:3-deoxy-manno-octulosonate cytidylyltransferase (CMP-KDO synthetase)